MELNFWFNYTNGLENWLRSGYFKMNIQMNKRLPSGQSDWNIFFFFKSITALVYKERIHFKNTISHYNNKKCCLDQSAWIKALWSLFVFQSALQRKHFSLTHKNNTKNKTFKLI